MKPHFSRRNFLSTLAAASLAPSGVLALAPSTSLRPQARPGSAKPLAQTADRIIDEAGLSGEVSFAVFDLNTGRPLEARNPTKPMPPPASPRR